MIVLVAGAGGMLGRDLTERLAPEHRVHPFPEAALDITDFSRVREVIGEVRPDLVVNCAAYTDVDGCEEKTDLAFAVNALGARHLAVASHEVGAALLHVSTDYVFDGGGTRPYTEFDPVGPVTVYGRSKLAGEAEVRAHCPRHYIVRTAWLYGRHGRNFVHTILRLAAEKERLSVVDDQVGSPTWTCDLAEAITRLAETRAFGTYHATGAGQVSWCGFAREILRLRGPSTPVDAVTSAAFPRPARRPAFSALDGGALARLGIRMRPWGAALSDYLGSLPPGEP